MSGSESAGKIPVLPLSGKALSASGETRTVEPASNEALPPVAQAPGEKTAFDPSSSFFPQQLPDADVDGKRKRRLFVWAGVAVLVLAIALGYAYLVQGSMGVPNTDSATEAISPRVTPTGPAASGPVVQTGTIRAPSPQPRMGTGATPPQETTSANPAPSPRAAIPGASRTRLAPANPVVPRVTHTRPTAATSAPNVEKQLTPPALHPQPSKQACSAQVAALGLCERPATNEPTLGESER